MKEWKRNGKERNENTRIRKRDRVGRSIGKEEESVQEETNCPACLN